MAATASFLEQTTVRRTLVVFAAILLIAIVARVAWPSGPRPLPPPQREPTSAAPRTYQGALERTNGFVASAAAIAGKRQDEWLQQERLAQALVTRARLTGSFDDYAAAQAALDQAFKVAIKGAGPHLTQANLDMSLHRLTRAEQMLDAIDHYAVPPTPSEREVLDGIRGDIAFYRGRYAEAAKLYTADPFRRAVLEGRTGKVDAALASLDAVERSLKFPTAQTLASLAVQRGELELQRGARVKAGEHFARAERLFPGWWLAEAHSAQMLALFGRPAEAIPRLAAVAQRAGAPEAMDALASIYRAQGDAANAKLWSDRAGAVWARRVAQLPEGAWGHAVEHELAFGDTARALDMARQDFAARPYGQPAVALAQAWLANNRPDEALRVLKPVLASDYVSAEQHAVAAQAYLLSGDAKAAAAERKAATAINRHALDRDAALVWFGH